MAHLIKKDITLVKALIITVFAVCLFGFYQTAQAASAFTATVDVVEDAIVLGEPVTLQWYVTGGPATCNINNGVGNFSVTQDPESGTFNNVIPPESGDAFVITCTRGGGDGDEVATDTLVLVPNPVVTFGSSEGVTEITNGLSGSTQIELNWSAEYATRCTDATYRLDSSPDIVRTPPSHLYRPRENRFRVSGGIIIKAGETFTASITCINDAQGTEETASVTITVNDPLPPDPVLFTVARPTDDPVYLTKEVARRYASVRYEFSAENATYCTDYAAYNLHEYPEVQTDLPEGYYAWSGIIDRRVDLRLGTSTVLTVRCGRPAITIGETFYPATSTILVKTFVLDGSDEDLVLSEADPAVTISAAPQTVDRNLTTGFGYTTVVVEASNIDYCYLKAQRMSNDEEYHLAGWSTYSWQRIWSEGNQDLSSTYLVALTESTRLTARCRNIYDHYFGTVTEQGNANVWEDVDVTVNTPAELSNPPEVWLYSGPSVHMTAGDVWGNQVVNNNMEISHIGNGLNMNHVNVDYAWSGNELVDTYGSITFTFDHPHGSGHTDVYNIHMRYCDESDGTAEYEVSTDRSGLIGSFTSDMVYPDHSAACDSSTSVANLIAEGVVVGDGDEITVTCTASQNDITVRGGEVCRFSDIYFGTGDGDRVITVPTSTSSPQNQIIWMSQGADRCIHKYAETDEGAVYRWSYGSVPFGTKFDSAVSAITTYSIECDREIDGIPAQTEVEVILATDPDAPLEVEETVSDTDSYSFGSCYDVAPEPDVLLDTAPANYVVAPENLNTIPDIFVLRANQCVPLVDLSVAPVLPSNNLSTDSIISIADGVDNVNGTYDLSIIPYVQNLSVVDLPANAQIPYQIQFSSIDSGVVTETQTGFYNTALPANTPLSTYQLASMDIPGVPFGSYNVNVRFNLDGSPNYPDSSFGNNQYSDSTTLPVPEPHMTLGLLGGNVIADNSVTEIDVPLVRANTNTALNWSVNVNYPMECSISGPSIGTQSITLETVGSNTFGANPSTGSIDINVQSSAEFDLTCREPNTNTYFTQTGSIEVVPNFQEF